ncbi:MAG TPA: hypothetical protein VJ649_11890, partial [Actinomycetes bacterium]|nr:hypothetical protein [Actinomycetes bacterium]
MRRSLSAVEEGTSMTTPGMPPGDSDNQWVDGSLEAGADADTAEESAERPSGEEGTGVEIGQGEPSS